MAQKYELLKTIAIQSQTIEVDQFGSIYVINNYSITKLNTHGEIQNIYNNDENGPIQSIDVSNPLKILVFYKDFGIVELLDQKLNNIYNINFSLSGFQSIKAIASSKSEDIWILEDLILKKIDKTLHTKFKSDTYIESQPTKKMIEYDDRLFILSLKNILIFDMFCNLIDSIKLEGISTFQLINKKLIFFKDNKLFAYNLKNKQIDKMRLPILESILDVKLIKKRIIIQKSKSIYIYGIKH